MFKPSPFALLLLALTAAAPLRAHDPGLSSAAVELRPDSLVLTLEYAPADFLALEPAATGWKQADFTAAGPSLRRLAPGLAEVRAAAGPLAWREARASLTADHNVRFRLVAARPAAARLVLRLREFARLPPGHRAYLSVADEQGRLLQEKLADAANPDIALPAAGPEAAPPPPSPTFWSFLKLGIAHIWTGYDHLLFLFGLLVVCRSFRSIVTIISCFTLAHSLTLALATLNVVHLPSRVVEPMIAASIVFVGLENLFRRGAEPPGRWAITFAFGLIHGFGFASVLRELGVGSNGHGLALPLFTFNLGVEAGQVAIAALVLPVVWKARRNPVFVRRGVPILSAVVAAAGLYWFIERTLF